MIADKDSRVVDYSEEYIPTPLFEQICMEMGINPTVDLMASESNRKTKWFINRGPSNHPDCLGIEFFSISPMRLEGHVLYVFPPKVMLTKVLSTLANSFTRFQILLIFPVWEEMPVGWARVTKAFDKVKMLVYRNGPLSIIPDDKQLIFRNKVININTSIMITVSLEILGTLECTIQSNVYCEIELIQQIFRELTRRF